MEEFYRQFEEKRQQWLARGDSESRAVVLTYESQHWFVIFGISTRMMPVNFSGKAKDPIEALNIAWKKITDFEASVGGGEDEPS